MYKILIILVSCFAGLLAFLYSDERWGAILSNAPLGGFMFFASILYGCCILVSLAFSPHGLEALSKQDSQKCMQLIDEIYTTITRCNVFAFLFFIAWSIGLAFIASNKLLNAVIIFAVAFLFSLCILYLARIIQYGIYAIKEIALYGKES